MTIEIHGLDNGIKTLEAQGLSKCFNALSEINEEITEGGIGFNANSGYVYIALENGVSINSCMGGDVEFSINVDDGEESFETYEEALEAQQELNGE